MHDEFLVGMFENYSNKTYAFIKLMTSFLPRVGGLALALFIAGCGAVSAQNDLNLALSKPVNNGATATASASSTENGSLAASN
ncbi:MAG: hypothetical protein EOO63_11220, partial [Hymenobacter sp.]